MSAYDKKELEAYLRELLRKEEEKNASLETTITKKDAEIMNLQKKVEVEQDMNCQLKRIMRERSNAAREITPKKEHDGYIILRVEQYEERIDGETVLEAWRSQLQTPYPAELCGESVCFTIESDLIVENILSEMGCNEVDFEVDIETLRNAEENTAYRIRHSANCRSGFMEVTLYTTGPLRVSKNRMPQPPKKK